MGEILENVDDPQKAQMVGIDPQNYALDEEKVSRFKKEIVSLFPMIEAQRVPMEERWNRYHHVWARKNTSDSRFYTGVNDAYFPVGFANVETLVAYLTTNLFQAGPKFALRGLSPMTPPQVIQKLSTLMTYYIHQANMELMWPQFVRQGVVMGPTVVKNVWRDEHQRVYKPQIVMGPNGPQVQPVQDEITLYKGPTFQVVDMLAFYCYPYYELDLDRCQILYEKIDRDFRDIQNLENRGVYLGTERLKNSQEMAQNSRDAIRRNVNMDFRTQPYGLSRYQIRDPNVFTLNEVWCWFDLNGDGYRIPCKAVVANDIVIELRQNPFWTQRPPYRMWRAIQHQDHIWGMGVMEIIEHHQYTLNAIINQALDANLFQTNQMVAIDGDRYQGLLSEFEMVPASMIPFSTGAPVQDAIQFLKPENTAAEAFSVANIVAGSMQDSIGTPPVTQGKFSNKERTATEVNAVGAGASIKIDVMVRNLALSILQTWLEDSFALTQQFCQADMDFKITGMPPIQLSPSDVNQSPLFQWLTAQEADAYMQQQAQAMAMAQAQQQATGRRAIGSGNEPHTSGQQTPAGPSEGLGTGSDVGSSGGPGG
jgi:hypothetical protein